jgi:hypothetical protein
MKVKVTHQHIEAAQQDLTNVDPVVAALEAATGTLCTVGYNTIAWGSGKSRVEVDTPEELRIWMAIWDAGGNEGPIAFDLPIDS